MPLIQAIIGGGLGNKFFGYCFARAYAERMGCDLDVQGGLYPQGSGTSFLRARTIPP